MHRGHYHARELTLPNRLWNRLFRGSPRKFLGWFLLLDPILPPTPVILTRLLTPSQYKLQPETSTEPEESSPLGPVPQDVLSKAVHLGNSVKSWRAERYDSGPRALAVEAWRSSILLYLMRLFQLPGDTYGADNLIASIFDHAQRIPSGTSWRFSILWPLFQVGLCLGRDEDERKAWLRHELQAHFQALGCSHARHALCALEQAWNVGDHHHFNSVTLGEQYRRLVLV